MNKRKSESLLAVGTVQLLQKMTIESEGYLNDWDTFRIDSHAPFLLQSYVRENTVAKVWRHCEKLYYVQILQFILPRFSSFAVVMKCKCCFPSLSTSLKDRIKFENACDVINSLMKWIFIISCRQSQSEWKVWRTSQEWNFYEYSDILMQRRLFVISITEM